MPKSDQTAKKSSISQRRSQRLLLRVQVVAERRAGQPSAKSESTETLAVNAHGALFLLTPPVDDTEPILIKNLRTDETQMCRVVYQGSMEGGRLQVGVEFISPSPNFWRVSFPPEDWGSHGREGRPAKE